MDRIAGTAFWTAIILMFGTIMSLIGKFLLIIFAMAFVGGIIMMVNGPPKAQRGPVPVTDISARGYVGSGSHGTMIVTNHSDREVAMTTIMCGKEEFWIRNLPAGQSETRNFYAMNSGPGPMSCEAVDIRS